MEIDRHQSLQPPQRLAPEGSPAQSVGDGVVVQSGLGACGAQGYPLRGEIRVDPVHGVVERVHARQQITKDWALQGRSQKAGLGILLGRGYPATMPYDPQRARAAIRHYIETVPIEAATWCKKAGLSRNALGEFLAERSESLKVNTVCMLADAIHVHPLQLMGIEPPPEVEFTDSGFASLLQLADRATRVIEGSADDARNVRDLVRATVRAVRQRRSEIPRLPATESPLGPSPPRQSS